MLATHCSWLVSAMLARDRADNLARALQSNREIGVAMGILMQRHRLTREQAIHPCASRARRPTASSPTSPPRWPTPASSRSAARRDRRPRRPTVRRPAARRSEPPMVRPSRDLPPPIHHIGPFRTVSVEPRPGRGQQAGSLAQRERAAPMDSESARMLTDDALSEEIRLLGELVLAASSVTRHLTQAEVDQVLDLETSPACGRPSSSTCPTTGSRRAESVTALRSGAGRVNRPTRGPRRHARRRAAR